MTHDDRRIFIHRAVWTVIPGLVGGLLASAVAYGVVITQIDWIRSDLSRLQERVGTNTDSINYHRIEEHE